MALALLLAQPAAWSATIVVDAGCSLVDAIHSANDDAAVAACAAGSGPDTIELTGDVILNTSDNYTDGDNGLPSVTSEMTVDGKGFLILRDPGPATPRFRILHVAGAGNLTLKNITVSGGSATGGSETFGPIRSHGGGIYSIGTLTLDAAEVSSNEARLSGDFSVQKEAQGGGIFNRGSLTLLNGSAVSNNEALGFGFDDGDLLGEGHAWGGGISSTWRLSIDDSVVSGNRALSSGTRPSSVGGGILASGLSVEIINSSVSQNLASTSKSMSIHSSSVAEAYGGGLGTRIDSAGSSLQDLIVEGSTFFGNQATVIGATSSSAVASGGALSLDRTGDADISNSTFTGNWAIAGPLGTARGGAWSTGGFVSMVATHVTLMANLASAGTVQGGSIFWNSRANPRDLINSIVAFSSPGSPDDCFGAGLPDGGGNFGCFPAAPAVTGLVSGLVANGGPTDTHALSDTSNARDAGASCPLSEDQRGVSRLGGCDSGAYEYNPCTSDDAFEDDDSCGPLSHFLNSNFSQTLLHCDEDWLYFLPEALKTYEFLTTNLVGGADTVINVTVDCGPVVASDNDSGIGLASRVVVVPDSTDLFRVQITENLDSYNPGSSPPGTTEGYEILVRCIEDCGCDPPEGPELLLSDDSVSTAITYEACTTVTASNWAVEPTGVVLLRAGERVVFENNVEIGGSTTVEIDTGLLPPP